MHFDLFIIISLFILRKRLFLRLGNLSVRLFCSQLFWCVMYVIWLCICNIEITEVHCLLNNSYNRGNKWTNVFINQRDDAKICICIQFISWKIFMSYWYEFFNLFQLYASNAGVLHKKVGINGDKFYSVHHKK